jgi:transposase
VRPAQLEQLNLNAAGIDVGATEHWVAVPADRDAQPVQRFGAFTADLYTLAEWLRQCQIDTVVMESTGVYWIALFEVLEERGFDVKRVDPHSVRQVPGRKTDAKDCQWLQELHTYGLLRGAFRPEDEVCVLRSYLRQRSMLVAMAARSVQHMQKALEQMNLKLTEVVSDITGKTGMTIIRAILEGERDSQVLATHRDKRCKHDQATLAKALLRVAAQGLVNSHSALGAYYRRMRARLGAPKAITATAHKLARLVYSMLRYGADYVDAGQQAYEKQYRDRVLTNLQRKARAFGYRLVQAESIESGAATATS